MTTVQTMLMSRVTPRAIARLLTLGAVLALVPALPACTKSSTRGRLEPPEVLVAPGDPVKGDALWAVVPLNNESGVSFVDALAFSDTLAQVITEARGLTCVPMNRTLQALRAMGNRPINSPQAALMLANQMGVDGVVIGSITAYDPYEPPKIGLTLALFVRDTGREDEVIDPIKLQSAYTEQTRASQTNYLGKPASVVSEHFDAASHDVQLELRRFATGRTDPDSSMGWRTGIISMDLYTKFAAHQAVSRLLESERLRLAQPAQQAAPQQRVTR